MLKFLACFAISIAITILVGVVIFKFSKDSDENE